MYVLQTGRQGSSDVIECWSKFGIRTIYLPSANLLSMLNDVTWRGRTWVDAIVVVAIQEERRQNDVDADVFEPADATHFAERVRRLHDSVAMPDGRKWNAIPIFIVGGMPGVVLGPGLWTLNNVSEKYLYVLPLDPDWNYGATEIVQQIREYRESILSELDNLGFLVTYEAGRYRLGPALRPRAELSGRYYFGPADRRTENLVTIDRDHFGIQLEADEFEALINRPDVLERELQTFFEDHPYFLSLVALPIPHIRLRDHAGKLLVPDLILKPLVAARRDSRWEVLELKLPAARLTAGAGTRRRLSHEVWKAISQLREYGTYFADPRNEAEISAVLSYPLRRPKLAVLIGRTGGAEVETLEAEQAHLNDVQIVTYDEILEQQRVLLV